MQPGAIQLMKDRFDALSQRTPDDNVEFWFARDLMEPLGYARWENFQTAIQRAIESCETTGSPVEHHFRGVTKMVKVGSGAERPIDDLMLTRYACYLIAQNGDPRKEPIAFAQSYFAIQTRKQELIEDRMRLQARLDARERLRESEKTLSQNIYERGVDDAGFGRIRSQGDAALFGGHTTQAMKDRFGITKTRPLADFLPTLTIAARNLATEITNHNVSQDTPFFHHVASLAELQLAADPGTGKLYTFHFNALRSIMEKTASFFGYADISFCLKVLDNEEDRALYNRVLNLLSHGKYAIHKPTEMGEDNQELFRRILRDFTTKFQFDLPDILAAAPVAAVPVPVPTP